MKRTVLNLLTQAAEKYAQASYVSEKTDNGWTAKTFSEVETESTHFASALLDFGFEKENKVAILAEGRNYWVVSEFAALKAGCVTVPLSIKLAPSEVLFRLNHSGAKAAIVSFNIIAKVLEIWDEIEIPDFRLFCIDDNIEELPERFPEAPAGVFDNVFSISQLIEQGRNNLNKHSTQLQTIHDNAREDDLVTISYTSGTTGNPKGAMLTHLNYYANSKAAIDFFGLPDGFRTLVVLPLDHAFAHTVGIYDALWKGFTLYFVDSRGGSMNALKNIPINLKEVSPDFLLTVPALTGSFMKKINEAITAKGGLAKRLFDAGMEAGQAMFGNGYTKVPLSEKISNYLIYKLADLVVFSKVRKIFGTRLKYCVGGGALLDLQQQKFFYTLGVPVYQGYGLTEAAPVISTNAAHLHKLGTSGSLLSGIECKIMNAKNQECKNGEKGEIVIRGENVMKGYYKNPEATAETIKDQWLYTGDMGHFDNDGFLHVTGREKALLISADGEKYSPEEIEEAITNSSELVAQTMLYNDHRKYTVALITLDDAKVKQLIKENEISDGKVLLHEIKKSFFNFKQEKTYKGKFVAKWLPTDFRIIKEPFSEANKMINSTMKMVRPKITETYIGQIEKMYNTPGKKIHHIDNEKILNQFFADTKEKVLVEK